MSGFRVTGSAGTGLLALLFAMTSDFGQSLANRTERFEWFRDHDFGLFIHWSAETQLGSVISHAAIFTNFAQWSGAVPKRVADMKWSFQQNNDI